MLSGKVWSTPPSTSVWTVQKSRRHPRQRRASRCPASSHKVREAMRREKGGKEDGIQGIAGPTISWSGGGEGVGSYWCIANMYSVFSR